VDLLANAGKQDFCAIDFFISMLLGPTV